MTQPERKNRAGATVTLLQHIHCETPGIISDCLQAAGIDTRWIRTFEQDPIPRSMDAQAGLLIMGGPMNVYDHEQFPFLLDEQRLIEAALKDNKPVLGVCLGSQLLAATLGAEVKRGAQKEIGWHPITLEQGTVGDALWQDLPQQFTAYHWHGDTFELPYEAVSLASSELTPCQGFRYRENAYGILFHMEITVKIIQNMVKAFSEELEEENVAARSIIEKIGDFLPNLQTIGYRVFQRWAKSL